MSELKDLRYIKSVRVNVNGQWRTNLKFTDEAIKMLSTDDGISGVLYIDSYTASSYITSTNIDNNPNGLLSIGAAPHFSRISKSNLRLYQIDFSHCLVLLL